MSNVKNIRVKPVELKIDNETYKIKYDFNAFIELEEMYGSIDEAMEAIQGEIIKDKNGKSITILVKDDKGKSKKTEKRKFSLKVMRDFLWAGLLYGDETITKRAVAHLLEFGNFQYVVEKMMEAIKAGLPEKEDDEKN